MSNQLRVCHPFNFKLLFEYVGKQFIGPIGPFAIDLLDAIKRGSNITLQIRSQNDQVGEEINGSTKSYSGCIGLLQTNQTDAMLYLTEYPHPATNISQGLVMMDSTINIFNFYTPHAGGPVKLAQIENLFKSFSVHVWILCVLTMIAGIGVLFGKESLNNWFRRMIGLKRLTLSRYKKIPYEVVSHMIDYGQLSNRRGMARKMIFLSLSLFSLLVLFYLSACIKTELVVVSPPKTLRSYQDLLDNQCGTVFVKGMNDYRSFKFAPEGSKEKRLWDYTVSRYSMDVVVFSYSKSLQNYRELAKLVLQSELSFILNSQWSPAFMRFYCDGMMNDEKKRTYLSFILPPTEQDYLPLISRDEDSQILQWGFISNIRSSGPLDRLEKTIRRIMEAGIPDMVLKVIEHTSASIMTAASKGNATFGNMEKCVHGILFMPDAQHDGVKAGNIVNFPRYAVYLVLIQLSVLFIEVVMGRCCKPHRVSLRKMQRRKNSRFIP